MFTYAQSINQSILFAKYVITAIVITVVTGQQGSWLHLQLPLKNKQKKHMQSELIYKPHTLLNHEKRTKINAV